MTAIEQIQCDFSTSSRQLGPALFNGSLNHLHCAIAVAALRTFIAPNTEP
jgi:hypothetical protein